MRILADTNVPQAYVNALRGDGHDVTYSRTVPELGPTATDEEILTYAESDGRAVLSTDVKDFARSDVSVAVLVAPQDMRGGAVQTAVSRLDALPLDLAEAGPLWLTSV